MKKHCVIMAGGRGTRFWPESRNRRPKQLIALAGEKTLLEDTIERMLPLCPPSQIHIMTGADIRESVQGIVSRFKDLEVIAEPKGRNTAPCIAYMAARISHFWSPEDIMIVLPSDHMISNNSLFLETISVAANAADKSGTVVTIGISPDSPHTGYGYIKKGRLETSTKEKMDIYRVDSFKEKPDLESAREFVNSGSYLWNAGMFMVKAGVMMNKIKEHMPSLYSGIQKISSSFDTNKEWDVFNQEFGALPAESIDFGVIEKLNDTLTIPGNFGWNDLGSWNSLYDLKEKKQFGISNTEKIVSSDSSGNIVNSSDRKKLIALLGVRDLIVVDTGDVLLVADRNSDQKVKDIVDSLKQKKMEEYL